MQKPSERIEEIVSEIAPSGIPFNPASYYATAIMKFLDEQSAKQDLSSEYIEE